MAAPTDDTRATLSRRFTRLGIDLQFVDDKWLDDLANHFSNLMADLVADATKRRPR